MSSQPYDGAHVLVLGIGARARRARELLAAGGAILVNRFDSEVTYVVVDRSVRKNEPSVLAARRAAVPVLTTAELAERPDMAELADMDGGTVPEPLTSVPMNAAGGPPMGPVPRQSGPLPVPYPPARPPMPPPPMFRPPAPPPQWRPPVRPVTPDPGAGLAWAASAFFTGGIATPFTTGYAAVRLSSVGLATASAGYAAAWALVMVTVLGWNPLMTDGFGNAPAVLVVIFAWLTNWLGGVAHGYQIGSTLRLRLAEGAAPVSHGGNATEVAKVEHRRRLRQEARALAARDILAAHELHIGRPDLPGDYDDGGLIDVNSAPKRQLERLPGVNADIADQIIRHRESVGPFETTSEVVVHTDLTPAKVDEFDEIALFLGSGS